MVKNEYGKVFGGFTPVPWESPRNGTTNSDPSNRSFTFNLDHKDKLSMKPVINTLLHRSDYGPCFYYESENHDLLILNSANSNRNSFSVPGNNYVH